jgi:hypothetical protein
VLRKVGEDLGVGMSGIAPAAQLGAPFPRVFPAANLVEAFPNAFLGVVLGPGDYEPFRLVPRGAKFMRLYEAWRDSGRFETIREELELPESLATICRETRQRDQRAALVCLLTAAAVAAGRYTAVGDPIGGYFFLPPWSQWSNWALDGVRRLRRDLEVEVWIDGQRFEPDDELD